MVQGQSGSWQPVGAAGAAAVTLLVLAGMVCCLLPSASAAHYPARISISFESDSYVAGYNESGPSLLYANGTVSVKTVPGCCGVVTLEAVIDTGWRLLVSPSTLIGSEHPTFFTVTVVVPQGTPHNLPARLNVICWSTGIAAENASTLITAGPVFGLELRARTPVIVVDRAESFLIPVQFTNTGNAVDTFWIDASHICCAVYYERWFASAGCLSVPDLAPGKSRTINITAVPNTSEYAPRQALSGMELTVDSLGARDHQMIVRGTLEIAIYVRPGWFYWADVDVPMGAVILWAAAMCAIVASAVRTRKRRKSLRVPILKEVGKDDRP